jgi:hypothetical protein
MVLVKALLIAQSSEAPEITIDHLLAALDDVTSVVDPAPQPAPSYLAVPKVDLPLSSGAAAALEPLGDFSDVSLDVLRRFLLDAKYRGLR